MAYADSKAAWEAVKWDKPAMQLWSDWSASAKAMKASWIENFPFQLAKEYTSLKDKISELMQEISYTGEWSKQGKGYTTDGEYLQTYYLEQGMKHHHDQLYASFEANMECQAIKKAKTEIGSVLQGPSSSSYSAI